MARAEQAAPSGGKIQAHLSSFSGRRALVVGGSGGIGSAVSAALSGRGASVLVHGRSEAKIGALLASIRASEGKAEGFAADIRTPASFIEGLAAFGTFDVVVVAFGPFVRKPLASTSPADWEDMALLDLALPGALASHFLPAMLERGFGRFLFFGGSRTDAIRGYRSNAAYAAAKTGLGVLVKSLAAEGAGRDVAAVLACPGIVDTEYLDEKARTEAAAMAPRGLLLHPSDIARTALDLLEGDPCAASGAIVSLDAGFSP
jgi:3-oxoacyl-[acyl-carrier protein] reductase